VLFIHAVGTSREIPEVAEIAIDRFVGQVAEPRRAAEKSPKRTHRTMVEIDRPRGFATQKKRAKPIAEEIQQRQIDWGGVAHWGGLRGETLGFQLPPCKSRPCVSSTRLPATVGATPVLSALMGRLVRGGWPVRGTLVRGNENASERCRFENCNGRGLGPPHSVPPSPRGRCFIDLGFHYR
jgi:hypothetical protein